MTISRVEVQNNISGNTTPAFTSPFAIGDVVVVFGNYFPSAPAPSCIDSLGNSYSIVHNSGALYSAGPEIIFKTIVTVGGSSPTVTINGTGASRLAAVRYNGFTGIPTFLSGTDFVEATGTGTAVSTSTFNVSHGGELLVGMASDTGGATHPNPTDLSFITGSGNFQIGAFDSLAAHPTGLSAGATVGWSTTLPSSDTWYVNILGIWDQPNLSETPSPAALTLAGQAPNRVVGTVLTPNTAKVIDRCREAVRSIFLPSWKRDLAFN